MCVSVYVCEWGCMHMYICICNCVYTCVYMSLRVCLCVRARVCCWLCNRGCSDHTPATELFLALELASPLRLAPALTGSDPGEARGGTGCSARSPRSSCEAETAGSGRYPAAGRRLGLPSNQHLSNGEAAGRGPEAGSRGETSRGLVCARTPSAAGRWPGPAASVSHGGGAFAAAARGGPGPEPALVGAAPHPASRSAS